MRLEKQKTDLVILINVPHVRDGEEAAALKPEAGKMGPLVEQAMRYRDRILETFEIRDWELFVQD